MLRFVIGLGVLGIATAPAAAHGLLVTVTVTDKAVNVVAVYEGGEPVPVGSKVTMADTRRNELADGVTDEAGECRLPRPEPGVYTVTVDDKQGHIKEVVVQVREGESGTFGPSRWNRWVAAGVGLAVIAVGTAIAMRKKRKVQISPTP
jgi:hypothetical protein